MTADEIDTLVRSLGSILAVLRDAEPLDLAENYRQVGLRLTYQPRDNKMIAEARAVGDHVRRFVSEGTRPPIRRTPAQSRGSCGGASALR
jgi:hypothetical protein